jgi:prevent-host-death family protein
MKQIGISKLQTRLAEIVRSVRNEQVEYLVTVHGHPAAVLQPVAWQEMMPEQMPEHEYEAAVAAELAEIDAIIQALDACPSFLTSREVLEQMREERYLS